LKETWPAFAIQNPNTQAKYPLDQKTEMNAATLKKFVEDFVAGKIEPSLKSEPEPESNDGPVKIIVGTNFESIVMDKAKDVFLELYAPWCGHCKKLAPIWDELGEKMAGSHVVIAKMDGTENDLPVSAAFAIEGFPTLKFFKAETNEVIDYDGDRSLESLLEFVKTNAYHVDSINEDIKTSSKAEEAEDEDEHDEL
jgi:protein disulfide-isomerase A1